MNASYDELRHILKENPKLKEEIGDWVEEFLLDELQLLGSFCYRWWQRKRNLAKFLVSRAKARLLKE